MPRQRRNITFRKLLLWLVGLALLPVALAAAYIVVPPPLTPLMVIRLFEGEGLSKDWVSFNNIHPSVVYSVVAAEDNLFCQHNGFDWEAMQSAYDDWRAAQALDDPDFKLRGASTVSQQTAKNLFLWPTQTLARKALEFPLTFMLEKFMSKKRIMEIYLNIAEWGPGIYGVEAASQKYFGTSAKNLSWRQGAQLAAILPSPRKWKVSGGYAQARAGRIQARIGKLGPLLDCVRTKGTKNYEWAPAPVRATPESCPNCPKSKPPAGGSTPPLPVNDLPPLPSATPTSASAWPPTLPTDSPAPASTPSSDAPNTSSPGSATDSSSCSTSGCPESSPSAPAQPTETPAEPQAEPQTLDELIKMEDLPPLPAEAVTSPTQ